MLTAGDFDFWSGMVSVGCDVVTVAGPGASSVGAEEPVEEKKLVLIQG